MSARRRRALAAAGSLALAAYALALAMPPIWDSDLWWHLRIGEWIAAHRAVPTHDLWSCLEPERAWRSFNWLFQLGAFGLERAGGLRAIRIVLALAVVAGYGLFAWHARREARSGWIALALTLLLVLLYDDRIRPRPHVANLLGEVALAALFARGGRLDGARRRATFLGLFVLWANVHDPGAALGALAVAAGAGARLAAARLRREPLGELLRAMAWPVGLAALAATLTPYGPRLLWAAEQNIVPVRSVIGEWQPVLTYLARPGGTHHVLCALAPYAALAAVATALLRRVLRHEAGSAATLAWLERGAVPLCWLAASLTAMRFVYLAALPLAWLASAVDWRARPARAWLLGATASLGLLWTSFDYGVVRSRGGPAALARGLAVDVEPGRYPEAAVALLREARLDGRVFSPTAWGGYLLWFARPPRGVAVDGRYHLGPRTLRLLRTTELANGRDGAALAAALDALGIDVAVLPAGAFPFDEWPARWPRVAHDRATDVFLRAGSDDVPRVARLVGAADGEPLDRAATRFFGERLARASRGRVAALEGVATESAVHELAELVRLAGHPERAARLLVTHLRAAPGCVRAATELARALHALGHPADAYRLLRPAEGQPGLPPITRAWLAHLRAHAAAPGADPP